MSAPRSTLLAGIQTPPDNRVFRRTVAWRARRSRRRRSRDTRKNTHRRVAPVPLLDDRDLPRLVARTLRGSPPAEGLREVGHRELRRRRVLGVRHRRVVGRVEAAKEVPAHEHVRRRERRRRVRDEEHRVRIRRRAVVAADLVREVERGPRGDVRTRMREDDVALAGERGRREGEGRESGGEGGGKELHDLRGREDKRGVRVW